MTERHSGTLYRIRVRGALGEEWSGRCAGMNVTIVREDAETYSELRGPLPDQCALMGVLDRLHDRGATLLRVERVETDEQGR